MITGRNLKWGGFLADKRYKNRKDTDPGVEIWEDRYRTPGTKTGILWSTVTFFCYVCGVLGILYALTFILILTCRQTEGALVVTAACAVIWIVYFGRDKHPVLTRILCLLGACAAVYYVRDVYRQLRRLILISRGEMSVPQKIDLTETLVLLGLLCAVLLFWLTFIVKRPWIFYFFTVPIIFIGPLLGQVLDVTELCLFASFHMGMSVLGSASVGRGQTGKGTVGRFHTGAAGRCMALLGCLFAVFLIAAQAITENRMEQLLTISAKADGYLRQISSDLLGEAESDGEISRSNSYPSGKKQLEIVMSDKPEENLYLKGFTGSNYENGSWEPADEASFFETAARESGQGLDEVRERFQNREFYLVQSEKEGQQQTLSVRYVNQSRTEVYLPPVSKLQETSGEGYTALFYGEEDLEAALLGPQGDALLRYMMMEEQYQQYALQTYLQVPENSFFELKTLCEEHPMTDYESMTEFILGTLHSTASYTLTPGVAPYGQDPVEYFLFENGRGYCQHFASAAVLMYRYCQVPARYVTGYLAPAEAFTEQEDGSYRAVLGDGQAHAWAEIYLADKGWVPVETTPPGSVAPAEAAAPQENAAAKQQQIQNTPEVSEEPHRTEEHESAGQEDTKRPGWKKTADVLGLLAAFCAAAVCVWKYLNIRRKRRKRQYRRYRADRLFARMLEALHYAGCLRAYDGTEKSFPDALAETIPDISQKEARAAVQTVFREAFGPERISRKDTDAVLTVYEKTCRHVCKNLRAFKKWYFQYGKVYW